MNLQPYSLQAIGWIVLGLLVTELILVLVQVPHTVIWIVFGATIAVTARLLVGRRM